MKLPLILRLGVCGLLLVPIIARGQVRPHLFVGKLDATNVAPALDLNGAEGGSDFSVNFTQGGGSIAIVDGDASDGEALTVMDDTNHLVSATIRLTNNLNGAAETMGVTTTGTNIVASLGAPGASRTLTLTGYDSRSAYQQVLRTAIYFNTANPVDTTPRTVEFRLNDGSVQSAIATTTITITALPTPTPTPTATPTAPPNPTGLGNISTRLPVQTGDNVLIAGFIVTGTQDKKVIVRGIGPSLNLPDRLENPTLELHGSSGLLESNDDWVNSPNKQAILDSTIPPTNDLESAIVRTVPANSSAYTAILRGANDTVGTAVVEVYDLDRSVDSKLANISTRGFVQTGDAVLIAGTIILGPSTQKVIVRAIGPSLNLPGKLEDPYLELRDANGNVVDENDNWVESADREAIELTLIPPTHDAESAIVRLLPANGAAYTAIVRGTNNTTGIAVVEIYALN